MVNEETEKLALAYADLAGFDAADPNGDPPMWLKLRLMAIMGRREMQAHGFDIARLANVPDVPDNAWIKVVSMGLAAARAQTMADAPKPKPGDDGRSVNVLQSLRSKGFGLVQRKPLGESEL